MKKFAAWVLSVCLFSTSIFSQNISGIAKDEQGKALSGASIALKKAADSSIVKLAVSNSSGKYEFAGIQPGKYFINVSHVGLLPQNSAAFELNGSGVAVPDVMLMKADGKMKEVVVTSRKPVIEVRADKTILNVEGSINAVGQDALELLRKSPGVLVDRDDNLSLSGKNGVQVYIDGRPTPLSGKDLSEYLKTIQSSQIEAIEIITNPSAKYDAAGNAGIINIRLKKNKSLGTNGSVNAGYSQGIFPKYNAGLALNNRNKRMNTFGNYTYSRNRNEMFMNLYRKQLDTLFDQKSSMTSRSRSHGFKAGVDYFINSRQTFGVMVNGNFNENTFSNYSTTPISYIPTGVLDRLLIADNGSIGERNNVNFNANYRYADTTGRELNMDADYGYFRLHNDQMQPNYYRNPDGSPRDSAIYNMIAPTDIDIYTFKTDYEQNFRKGRLGVGGKISYVESTNDFQRYNVVTKAVKNLDTLRSNAFNYTENINALYANYNKAFKGFMVQFGLRVENTNAEGRSMGFRRQGGNYISYDSTFRRNYTDVFPSGAITFNKNPMKQWSISYSRRIDRPAYQDLNPFEFKLDEYTFQKGNTELRPQYTNSIGVTYMYKFKLTTTLNYSHVNDVFTQLIDTAEKSKSFITKKNLATQDIVSLNISYPFQYKWYSFFANLNTFYSKYEANFGTGRTINLDVFAFNFYSQHSARLGKGWTAELSGWYNSPSIWQGTFESKEMWSIDAGLQKTVLQGKGNVKVSVSDIFQSMRWGGTSNFAGQYMKAGGGWESRLFKLNFTYRFGSAQIKAARQRKTGLEDENKRVGSQGGGISN
ncbi:MAG TPA: TonB-dependent receptor [Chitinophagaceae bacterium]|nr:TonB-dependent receptor [Chitinophagaceae bacterium]